MKKRKENKRNAKSLIVAVLATLFVSSISYADLPGSDEYNAYITIYNQTSKHLFVYGNNLEPYQSGQYTLDNSGPHATIYGTLTVKQPTQARGQSGNHNPTELCTLTVNGEDNTSASMVYYQSDGVGTKYVASGNDQVKISINEQPNNPCYITKVTTVHSSSDMGTTFNLNIEMYIRSE